MYELEKVVIITNNNRVYEKYKDMMIVILLETYAKVLLKTRDMVYDRHVLLTHPQASSLKPNQTPYRSILVYPEEENGNMQDILLIEKCLEVFRQWQEIAAAPEKYDKKADEDFKTIDLSVIDSIISRIV